MLNTPQPLIITCDAGGTMTDVLVVDEKGHFSIGKASSTPWDESEGYWESLGEGLQRWTLDLERDGRKMLPKVAAAIYTGTSMLNTLIQRTGKRVGLIITKGFEDNFTLERGFQAIAGYSYADRLHSVTHYNNPPLIPRKDIRGVTERIDLFGTVVLPMYEEELKRGAAELLLNGVDALSVVFFYSYLNPVHELRAKALIEEVMAEAGRQVPVLLSSEVCPITREMARMNSVVIQAYAAEPARKQLFHIEDRLKAKGYRRVLQTVLAYGGLANIRYPRLYESIVSGPVGGLLGARYLGERIGEKNIVTADMGGTSFDIGLITNGQIPIVREPEFARFIFNLPMVVVDSVGAGAGSYIRLDPVTNRLTVGPESAGASPGPVCYDQGNQVPTVMDCDVALGIINPENYLGGKVLLNRDKALEILNDSIAQPLGLDVYDAAEGIVRLINTQMREQVRSLVLSRGYSLADYVLLTFGGAGPLHMAGFTEGLNLRGVLTVPYAAAFSAFGCATVDGTHRYQKSVHLFLPPGADKDAKRQVGEGLNAAWQELEAKALAEMKREGYPKGKVRLTQVAFVRYGEQLDDLEVFSPVRRIKTPRDLDRLVEAYEYLYERVYHRGAKYPQAGYRIMEVGVIAVVEQIKPRIVKGSSRGKRPPTRALKDRRRVYWEGKWRKAAIYDMEMLLPGNEIKGVAVVEAPDTTLFVPPKRSIRVDGWRNIWMT